VRNVVLYARPGCHLCDEARDVILAVRERRPFSFAEIDIEGDDDLLREYGIRIPVVTVDGEERFQIAVDRDAFAGLVGLPYAPMPRRGPQP
jgi:glutaredoxin